MQKIKILMLLLGLMTLLCACSADPEEAIQPSPTPAIVNAPEIQAEGDLANAARALLTPYEDYLDQVALRCKNNLSYTIPGDMMAKMAQDAQDLNITPVNDRYQFTWKQEGQHTYLLTGLDVQEEMSLSVTQPPEIMPDNYVPEDDDPMESQNTGDYTASGGGDFSRAYVYDVADDLSSGSIEITNHLNGELTGHEIFSFCVWNNELLFAYGALELTPSLDTLESTGSYLVTIGKFGKNLVETADYIVFSRNDIPHAVTMDFDRLLSSIHPLARISAKGNRIEATN